MHVKYLTNICAKHGNMCSMMLNIATKIVSRKKKKQLNDDVQFSLCLSIEHWFEKKEEISENWRDMQSNN